MSETQDLIGKILPANAERDAIHIAVAPMVAGEPLSAGVPVGLKDGKAHKMVKGDIGVVDPFLKVLLRPGDRFYLFLYPNTSTGLRHVYTHPVLDSKEVTDKAASEKWLREFAADIFYDYYDSKDFDPYAMLLQAAEEGDFCINGQPDWLYQEGAPEKLEMWHHLEVVLGKTFSFAHKAGSSFRCSC